MPRAPKQRPATWIEVGVRNAGFRKTLRALHWGQSWIFVKVAFGRDPSVDEVAEWWGQSRRTAFRDQAAFRDAYPTLETPFPIYNNPAQLARVKKAVDAIADLEASARARHRPSDTDLLDTGLLNPGS